MSTDTYIINSLTSLVAYEWLITIRQEVSAIWTRKWTGVTWLFFANRALLVANTIIQIAPYTSESCLRTFHLRQFCQVAQYVVTGVFSALRVYAIWDRNVLISSVVLLLNLVPLAIDGFIFSRETAVYVSDPILGSFCTEDIDLPDGEFFFSFPLVIRLCVIIADILVLVVTWKKTFRQVQAASRVRMNAGLSTVLLRDGTIYFLALLLMNVAQILIANITSLQNLTPITFFISILTPILISRFLLNLRQVDQPHMETEDDVLSSRLSAPRFYAPVILNLTGNIGEPLEHGLSIVRTQDYDDSVEMTSLTRTNGTSCFNERSVREESLIH